AAPKRPKRPGWQGRGSRSWSLSGNEAVVVTQRPQPRLRGLGCIARREGADAQAVGRLAARACVLHISVGHAGRNQAVATYLRVLVVGIGGDLENEASRAGRGGR